MPAAKDAPARLAEKLVQALRQRKQQGSGFYPVALKELAELADPGADIRTVLQAVHPQRKAFSRYAVAARKDLRAPAALVEDLALLAASPLLLDFLLEQVRSPSNQAWSVAKLKAKVTGKLQKPFQEAVNRRIEENSLAPTVGWLWINRSRNLFLFKDVHRGAGGEPPRVEGQAPAPAIPAPAAPEFGPAFAVAFDRLDRQTGGHNFVSLVDLRRELPADRATFDAELRRLRLAGRYTLSAAEGRHGLSTAEQDAGIPEDGALLLYVSRKLP
jgi:hypothetical protein